MLIVGQESAYPGISITDTWQSVFWKNIRFEIWFAQGLENPESRLP